VNKKKQKDFNNKAKCRFSKVFVSFFKKKTFACLS